MVEELNLKGKTITLLGAGIHEKLGGGARIGGLIEILKESDAKINLISFLPYSSGFKREHKKMGNQISSYMITFPSEWNRTIKAILLFSFNFFYVYKLSSNSDYIWTSCGSTLTNLPAILASKICRKPIIYDLLDEEVEIPEWLAGSIIKQADLVFTCSYYLSKKAESYKCQNIYYVPCFVDPNKFQNDIEARNEIRKKYSIDPDSIVIGYAGVLARGEGVAILLEAFKKLLPKYKNLKLAIMGVSVPSRDMDDTSKISEDLGIKENVIIFPPVIHSDVPKFLSICDILCSPKIDNAVNRASIAIKLIEYMSMSKPTISSAIGEVNRIVIDKENGFLAIPGDADDLASVIEKVIDDLYSSQEIAKNGRKRILQEFSKDVIAKKRCKDSTFKK